MQASLKDGYYVLSNDKDEISIIILRGFLISFFASINNFNNNENFNLFKIENKCKKIKNDFSGISSKSN